MARIMELARHSHTFHELALRPYDLGHPEYAALSVLRMQEPPHQLTPTELSRTLNQTTAGTSKTIDRLAGMGLVERIPHPRDNRRTLVRLTRDGITKAEQVTKAESALRQRLLALIGDEAEAVRVLDVLNNAFGTINRG
jgi:DNA-binding MarR family transcriptional regulator